MKLSFAAQPEDTLKWNKRTAPAGDPRAELSWGKAWGKNSYPNQHRPQRALVVLSKVCPNGARYLGKCCITSRDGHRYSRRVVKHDVQ